MTFVIECVVALTLRIVLTSTPGFLLGGFPEGIMIVSRRQLIAGLAMSAGIPIVRDSWVAECRPRRSARKDIRILYNENPLGASPRALKVAVQSLSHAHRYAFDSDILVRTIHDQVLEASNQTDTHRVVLGVGSTELLHAVAAAFVADGGRIVEAHPSYQAIGNIAQSIFSSVQRIRVPLDKRGATDIRAMLREVDSQTNVVVVTNPNNPTGQLVSRDHIATLAESLDPRTLLVVDEAYIDFLSDVSDHTAIGLIPRFPNLLVTRTFSKLHGLAGLRIGYGVGSEETVARLRPFLLGGMGQNVAGQAAAAKSLEDELHQDKTRQHCADMRNYLTDRLSLKGWKVYSSQTCFLWVNLGTDCTEMVKHLADRGVFITHGRRWAMPECVRISLGLPDEMEILINEINAF